MAKKQKFYVVWEGHRPGVYNTWAECQSQTSGFPGAKYKSFKSFADAQAAFDESHHDHIGTSPPGSGKKTPDVSHEQLIAMGVDMEAYCVDAACSGNPGALEFQGVTMDGQTLFHYGPFPEGTVNIGEFLAIVKALKILNEAGDHQRAIYSDSRIGMTWVRKKKAKSTLPLTPVTRPLLNLVEKAETWLQENSTSNPVLKWETSQWGEIPADFGRK